MDGRTIHDFYSLTQEKRNKFFDQLVNKFCVIRGDFDFYTLDKGFAKIMGVNLKKTRRLKGYKTSKELAYSLDVSPTKLNAWELGRAKMPAHELARWNTVFCVHPYVLFHRSRYQELLDTSILNSPKLLKLQYELSQLDTEHFFQLVVRMLKTLNVNESAMQHLRPIEARLEKYGILDIQTAIKESYYESVSEILLKFRVTTGISQRFLSELIGINEERYRRIEKPTNMPKFDAALLTKVELVTNIPTVIFLHNSLYGDYQVRYLSRFYFFLNFINEGGDEVLDEVLLIASEFNKVR